MTNTITDNRSIMNEKNTHCKKYFREKNISFRSNLIYNTYEDPE